MLNSLHLQSHWRQDFHLSQIYGDPSDWSTFSDCQIYGIHLFWSTLSDLSNLWNPSALVNFVRFVKSMKFIRLVDFVRFVRSVSHLESVNFWVWAHSNVRRHESGSFTVVFYKMVINERVEPQINISFESN